MKALGTLIFLAAATPDDLDRQISKGVALFQRLEDREALKVLREALAQHPTRPQEAKARLYVGLIAFNGQDFETARHEFTLALQADPAAAFSAVDSSPRSEALLKKIRRDLAAGASSAEVKRALLEPGEPVQKRTPMHFSPPAESAPDGGASRRLAPHSRSEERPPDLSDRASSRSRSYLPSYLFGGGALVALGGGILFGQLQGGETRAIATAADANQATNLGRAAQRDGIIADVLFGVAGAAAVTCVVLFFTTSSGTADPAMALGLSPTGLPIVARF